MCKIKLTTEVEISTSQIITSLMSGEMSNERREDIAVALMETLPAEYIESVVERVLKLSNDTREDFAVALMGALPEKLKMSVVERVFTGDKDKQLCMMLLEDEYEKLLEVVREVVFRTPGNMDEHIAKLIRVFVDPRGIHNKQEVCYDLQQLIATNL